MRSFPNDFRFRCVTRLEAAFLRLRCFRRDEAAAAAVLFAVAAPVLIGAMGLAAEVSYWRLHQRAMQNAADAAAIAAATNGGSTYVAEAQAVAAQYGFQNGTGNIAVTVTNPNTAPGCTSKCYNVQISDKLPLLLTSVVGFRGNTTIVSSTSSGVSEIHNVAAMSMQGSSTASAKQAYGYCVLALATKPSSSHGITSNGAPNVNLNGCAVMSNTGATCNGANLGANIGNAHGTNSGCGIAQYSNVAAVVDPYSGLASSIPSDTCPAIPVAEQWSGPYNIDGNRIVCGDLQLAADTTINSSTSAGAVLVIKNGQLNTNGHKLTGNALTIVFSGTNNASYQHIPSGNGILDIAAPTTGAWSGVAIYQNPALTTNVDISYAGNNPSWNLTGLVYLPHSSFTLAGAVGTSTSGARCFVIVVDNMTINGTGSIFNNNTQCGAAGLNQVGGGYRGTLVN